MSIFTCGNSKANEWSAEKKLNSKHVSYSQTLFLFRDLFEPKLSTSVPRSIENKEAKVDNLTFVVFARHFRSTAHNPLHQRKDIHEWWPNWFSVLFSLGQFGHQWVFLQ